MNLLKQAAEALEATLNEYGRNICEHENTHRGGVIWTICDDCDAKWADDRGGFVPYQDPEPIKKARETLSALQRELKGNRLRIRVCFRTNNEVVDSFDVNLDRGYMPTEVHALINEKLDQGEWVLYLGDSITVEKIE